MSDIFISYAAEDRELARSLAGALSAQGWQVWWDREIPFGRSFDEVIETAVADARSMIVLWSRHSVESDWVRSEAREGRARRILLPVLIEPVRIPLEFRHLQTADLTDWVANVRHPQFDQLIAQLGKLLGSARPSTVESRALRRDGPLDVDIPLRHDARTFPVTPTAPPIGRRVAIAALAASMVGIAGVAVYRMSMGEGTRTPTAVGTLGRDAAPPPVASSLPIDAPATPGNPVAEPAAPAPATGPEKRESSAGTDRSSRGPTKPLRVRLPDLEGQSVEDARTALDAMGLAVGKIEERRGATAAGGTILDQLPSAGATVPVGTAIDLVIAVSPPSDVEVPNLMTLPLTQARGSLTNVGLGVGEISEVGVFVDTAVNEPKVRGQQPAAGTRVPLGARIAITVAVPGVRVPQLVRRTVSEAQGLLREVGLTLKSDDTLKKSSVVTNQVPSGGRVVRAGEVVTVTVRAAPPPDAAAIAVPSVIGLHFEEAIEVFRRQGFTRVRPQPKLDRSPRGQVLSQSPEAGKQVPPDTGISFFYGTATVGLRTKNRIANREQAAALCPAVCAAVQAKWSEWFPEKPDQCYCALQ